LANRRAKAIALALAQPQLAAPTHFRRRRVRDLLDFTLARASAPACKRIVHTTRHAALFFCRYIAGRPGWKIATWAGVRGLHTRALD
jgi:hypothetical protein